MIKKLLSLVLLLHATAFGLHAKALPTNFIQSITFTFTAVGPGKSTATSDSVSNVVLTTRTAIAAIGAATSNSFSAKAQILAVASIFWYTNTVVTTNVQHKVVTNNFVYGYANSPSFVIKDGSKTVDITGFVNITTLNSDAIYSSAHHMQGTFSDYTAYKQYRLRSMSISQTPIVFSAQGFVVTPTLITPVAPGVVFFAFDDNWTDVTGMGSLGGNTFILQGSVSATFVKLQ